jgi:hypothetical protein
MVYLTVVVSGGSGGVVLLAIANDYYFNPLILYCTVISEIRYTLLQYIHSPIRLHGVVLN